MQRVPFAGRGERRDGCRYSERLRHRYLAHPDLSGDGKPDLAVTNYSANTVSVLLGAGNGTFQAKVDYPTGRNPKPVAAGDVNRDGKPDLVIANFDANTVSVLLGAGGGTFQAKVDYLTGQGPLAVRWQTSAETTRWISWWSMDSAAL